LAGQDGPKTAHLTSQVVPSNNPVEGSYRRSSGSVHSIGGLFYLTSIGLIAGATIAIFFGVGLSMLVQSAGGTISELGARPLSEVRSSTHGFLPASENNDRPALADQSAPMANNGERQRSAALPPAGEVTVNAGTEALPHEVQGGASAPKRTQDAAAPAPASPTPAPSALATTTVSPPARGLSAVEIMELLQHGDSLLRTGDIASARLFYERAADAGDGRAALRVGATFDPAFLGRAGVGKADIAEARAWYNRALDLGVAQARRQLNSLDRRHGR
jgi:hypothetical protein